MTSAIFLKTCRKDRFWASYCLRSLKKFASGFAETVLLIPDSDRPHFEGTDYHGARVVWVDEPDDGKGYLHQQNFKVNADTYTGADIIFMVDSDCFITSPMTPEMFMPAGKPIMLIRHWSEVGLNAKEWQRITEKCLKWPVPFETMAALPFVVDRRVLPIFRDYIAATHGKSVRDYILEQPGNEFSEFNALGSFAQRFLPVAYDWRFADPATDQFPRVLSQKWSWSDKGVSEFSAEYERILAA